MNRFITFGTDSGTVAINPANICYIKHVSDKKCVVKFVGDADPVTFDVSYREVAEAIVRNTGFTAQ